MGYASQWAVVAVSVVLIFKKAEGARVEQSVKRRITGNGSLRIWLINL